MPRNLFNPNVGKRRIREYETMTAPVAGEATLIPNVTGQPAGTPLG